MENGTLSNSNRNFGQSGNFSKGSAGVDGEGKTEPVMRVAPEGPSVENKPVAEPLLPFEATQMVQKIGSIVYNINSVAGDLNKSLSNPSIDDEQRKKIIAVINDLSPIAKKVFGCGMKLNQAFLPKRIRG